MANIHGKDALVYISDGTNQAEAVSEQNSYSIESDFETADTTELGDSWKTAVKGLGSWSARVEGNFDTGNKLLWTAHVGTALSKFYLYPERGTLTRYYYGTCWVKLGTVIGGGVTAKSTTSVQLVGDGTLSRDAT